MGGSARSRSRGRRHSRRRSRSRRSRDRRGGDRSRDRRSRSRDRRSRSRRRSRSSPRRTESRSEPVPTPSAQVTGTMPGASPPVARVEPVAPVPYVLEALSPGMGVGGTSMAGTQPPASVLAELQKKMPPPIQKQVPRVGPILTAPPGIGLPPKLAATPGVPAGMTPLAAMTGMMPGMAGMMPGMAGMMAIPGMTPTSMMAGMTPVTPQATPPQLAAMTRLPATMKPLSQAQVPPQQPQAPPAEPAAQEKKVWDLKFKEPEPEQQLERHRDALRSTKPAWMTKGVGVGTDMFGKPKGIIKPGDDPDKPKTDSTQFPDYDPMGDVFRDSVKDVAPQVPKEQSAEKKSAEEKLATGNADEMTEEEKMALIFGC